MHSPGDPTQRRPGGPRLALCVLLGILLAGAANAAPTALTRADLATAGPDHVAYLGPLLTPATPGHALEVDADIAGAAYLSLVVADGEDGYGCDHVAWGEARFITPAGEALLVDREWEHAAAGWGEVAKNRGASGRGLSVAGEPVQNAIGTHSPSLIVYAVPAGATRFRARAVLDDTGVNQGCGSNVQFIVLTDLPNSAQFTRLKLAAPPDFAFLRALRQVVGASAHDEAVREFEDLMLDLQRRTWTHTFHGGIADADTRAQQTYDRQALLFEGDRDPVDVVLRRSRALWEDLRASADLTAAGARLTALDTANAGTATTDLAARLALFRQAVALRREIAFANPLLRGLDRILFITREALPADEYNGGNHMCDQFFGFHATLHGTTKGDGLYVLEAPFSAQPQARNLLQNATVSNGRLAGKRLDQGGFLAPDLAYDAQRILFCYTEAAPEIRVWNERTTFHVFQVNADGTDLTQLTDGPWNDLDPCWLPNGRIAFISERRGGFGRCHGRPVPSYTLHSMFDDGTDIVRWSPHETNEWQPSVDANGMVVYTRWDYVDRGFNQAHHAWITFPDGRDARALNGNTHASERTAPHMEMDVRAVPGSPCYIAVAAGHHTEARGSLVLIDPRIPDDDAMAQVRRLTPDQLFPEAEFYRCRGSGAYATPWPLSERYTLCVYDHDANAQYGEIGVSARHYGIYLVDVFGNRELLYRHPGISCLSPMPLQPRPTPPEIPHATLVGRPRLPNGGKPPALAPAERPATAQMGVMNVYEALRPLPPGTRISRLRIWQVLPKSTPIANQPRIGYGDQKPAKAALGTVPVEADGSALWEQPAGIPVLFHALDEKGLAVQGMRSATYAQPGERLLCAGCHEPRSRLPRRAGTPIAMTRAPSVIAPDPDGANPFSFPRLVQPVLERYCVDCHAKDPKAPVLARGDVTQDPDRWYASFRNLQPYCAFYDNAAFVEPSTIPGQFGARASKLYELLSKGHHDLQLPADDWRRLTLWLDSNGLFFGHENDITAQAAGEVVQPSLQ